MRSNLRTLVATLIGGVLLAPAGAHATVRKKITIDRVTIRSFPDEYVLGNASSSGGWYTDVQQDPSRGYRWGMVHGPGFTGCAWITGTALADAPELGAAPAQSPCPTTHRTATGFSNGEVQSQKLPSGKRDGKTRHILKRCSHGAPEQLNVNPFAVPSTSSGDDGFVYKPRQEVRFRYTSRDGNWAMVRNPKISGGKGWGFISRGCLAAPAR